LPPSTTAQAREFHANPNVPRIALSSRGVRHAVVSLSGVDPRRSRPWDLPPVRVEQSGKQFHVRQGRTNSRVGFVRRGAVVEMLSRDADFYSLHAGGAAFFTLAFPDPDQPCRRRLDHKGLVELSSGAGHYWMRAYLFVDDHPYYARTDARGRFTLDRVPPGRYRLTCWLPDWHALRHERDPETGMVTRMTFAPPVRRDQQVTVRTGANPPVHFDVQPGDFGPR
jgi:hypothetical protein